MPVGPGKYDAECTAVREGTNALGAIVIVFGGDHGSGFSVQVDESAHYAIPEILEYIAREIRESNREAERQCSAASRPET